MRRCYLYVVLTFVSCTLGLAAGRTPDWWPEGQRPPYLSLAAEQWDDPSALRLQAASFRTDRDAARDLDERVAAALPASLRGAPIESGGWLLVQFAPAVSPSERLALLADFGAIADSYVPHNAWLARVPAGAVESLTREAGVTWVGRFHPAFKLSPLLGAPLPGQALVSSSAPDPWRLDLRLAGDADVNALRTKLESLGVRVTDANVPVMRVEANDTAAVVLLAALDEVLFIGETVEARTLNNSSRGICQGGTPGVESVHGKGVRGATQTVAVMDTGIDTRHCCFDGGGKIVDNRAWGGGVLGALCSGDHGTHVSGTVACDNGGDHDGLAPAAKLILQDIQKGDTFACAFGSVSPPNPLSGAWSDARTRGARVHSNSWGGGGNAYGTDAQAIDDFMWRNQDFLIVFAAGNSGSSPGSLGAYSNAKNSVTVGGVVNGSGYENMYGSSSRGPAGDGRTLPDLTTPAQGVESALNNKSAASCGWATYSGTSMATPAVAGSAALVRDYFERGFYPSGTASAANAIQPSAALVKATLLVSTRDMTGSGTGGSRPNGNQGFGRVTLDDALWFSGDAAAQRLEVLDDRNSATGLTSAGQEQTFTFGLKAAGPIKLMLVWTDAPGNPSAAQALVNDLDLVVTTADGKTYTGNQGFSGGFTTQTSGAADRLNNKEAVFLPSALPGPVTVKVRAASLGDVALHPQDFALLAIAPLDPTCTAAAAGGLGAVTQQVDGANIRARWSAVSASSYSVYRGVVPDFMASNPAPYRTGVQDEDALTPGVQWTDTNAASDGSNYYYLFFAANTCGELTP